jgi:hypothetical protein
MADTNPDRLTRAGILLHFPDRIEVRGAETIVGRVGLALLACLARRPVRARVLKVRLWQDPEAPDNRLKGVVYRVNRKFRTAGCDVRVALERGAVELV